MENEINATKTKGIYESPNFNVTNILLQQNILNGSGSGTTEDLPDFAPEIW